MADWKDGRRLVPLRKDTLHKIKTIWIEKKDKKIKGSEIDILIGTRGTITKITETKNKFHIHAVFPNKRKKYYSKNEATKILLQAINLNKKATRKLLGKILYTNFDEKTLQRIEKSGALFQRPREFNHHPEGQKMYLRIGNDKKYYEV